MSSERSEHATQGANRHREHCTRKQKEATTLGLGREMGDLFTGFSEFILLFSAFLASRSFSCVLQVTFWNQFIHVWRIRLGL
jgi:hypothetical protein